MDRAHLTGHEHVFASAPSQKLVLGKACLSQPPHLISTNQRTVHRYPFPLYPRSPYDRGFARRQYGTLRPSVGSWLRSLTKGRPPSHPNSASPYFGVSELSIRRLAPVLTSLSSFDIDGVHAFEAYSSAKPPHHPEVLAEATSIIRQLSPPRFVVSWGCR